MPTRQELEQQRLQLLAANLQRLLNPPPQVGALQPQLPAPPPPTGPIGPIGPAIPPRAPGDFLAGSPVRPTPPIEDVGIVPTPAGPPAIAPRSPADFLAGQPAPAPTGVPDFGPNVPFRAAASAAPPRATQALSLPGPAEEFAADSLTGPGVSPTPVVGTEAGKGDEIIPGVRGVDFDKIEKIIKRQQAVLDTFAGKDFKPDFTKIFAALEKARPQEADKLSDLEKLAMFLGGAAQGIAGVSPTPGNLGRGLAAAGGGGIRGAAKAQSIDRRAREKFGSLDRQVDIARAHAEQTLATAVASGDRQQALAALNASRFSFQGALKLAELEAKDKTLTKDAYLDLLRRRKLEQDIDLGGLKLAGQQAEFNDLVLARKLGLNAEFVKEGGVSFALANAIWDGTAGLPSARATFLQAINRQFAIEFGGLEADADQEDINSRVSQLLQLNKGLIAKRDEMAIIFITEILQSNKSTRSRFINEMQGVKTPEVQKIPEPELPPSNEAAAFLGQSIEGDFGVEPVTPVPSQLKIPGALF